ncbi:MAG: hypothetical protein SAL07_18460 [Oscillatoria sp. PMC 1051.18]|nr:hypothetical protein [Oscillatoria sp. PMC 1051.18]
MSITEIKEGGMRKGRQGKQGRGGGQGGIRGQTDNCLLVTGNW